MATSPKTHRPDELTLEVVDLIGAVVARYHEEYDEAAAEHALTGAQARLLSLLSLEPLPMRKLAQRLRCEPSNVTGIVDRLESRGLVERRPDPTDRRATLVTLTERGAGVGRDIREAAAAETDRSFAALDPEDRRTLARILRTLRD